MFRPIHQRPLLPVFLAAAVVALVLSPLVHLAWRAVATPEATRDVLAAPSSWELLGRSLLLAALVAPTSMIIGTALAWLTVRGPGGRAFRAVFTIAICLALAAPSYVIAFGLLAALGPHGVIGRLLPVTVHARDYPLASSWLVITSCTVPYVLLSVRAALTRECASLEDAALSLGAGRVHAFRRITLPRLMPSALWGAMLAALYSVADFGAVSLLGYRTLTWGIYHRYHTAFGIEEARSLSLMLAIVALGFILLMRFVRPDLSAASAAPPTPHRPARFTPRLAPLYLLALVPLGVGIALPLAACFDWISRSGDGLVLLKNAAQPAFSTVGLALTAALLITILALPLASLHLGRVRRSGRLLTPLTLLGFGVPGIVIAIAAVGLALSVDSWIEWLLDLPVEHRLYQSHLLLMLAYAALFLPEAAGPLRASAAKVHADQLDAASMMRSGSRLGASLREWRTIILPQLAPGIAAAASLVFITTAKELPATLILAPLNTRTLATGLWSAIGEAQFAHAAMAALLLMLIAAIGLAAAMLVERRSG